MRRSQRIIATWLLLAVMSLTPLLEVLAADAVSPASMATCQIELDAGINASQNASAMATMDCAQHHACMSYCQFAPLQSTGPQQMRASQFLWLAMPDKAENFNTRFLESIERPPRV